MTHADRVLGALGDATRRKVFVRLREAERSVGDLSAGLNVSRSAVSQHLKVLKAARLVRVRPEGTQRIYSADRSGLDALRAWLDCFWDGSLAAFKTAAELEAKKDGRRSTGTRNRNSLVKKEKTT